MGPVGFRVWPPFRIGAATITAQHSGEALRGAASRGRRGPAIQRARDPRMCPGGVVRPGRFRPSPKTNPTASNSWQASLRQVLDPRSHFGEARCRLGAQTKQGRSRGGPMDQLLYSQAVWFISDLDKRYRINKEVGWVYALRNSEFKKPLLKIGRTSTTPHQRARELGYATGVPGRCDLIYFVLPWTVCARRTSYTSNSRSTGRLVSSSRSRSVARSKRWMKRLRTTRSTWTWPDPRSAVRRRARERHERQGWGEISGSPKSSIMLYPLVHTAAKRTRSTTSRFRSGRSAGSADGICWDRLADRDRGG